MPEGIPGTVGTAPRGVLTAMILPGGYQGRRRWLIVALVALVLFLSLMFYED